MKIDYINLLIAACVSALLAWRGYSLTAVEDLKALVMIVTFVTLFISGSGTIALRFGEDRSSVVIRMTSGVFFVLLLLLNGVFAFFDFSKPLYVILNALMLLIMLVINRGVAKSRM